MRGGEGRGVGVRKEEINGTAREEVPGSALKGRSFSHGQLDRWIDLLIVYGNVISKDGVIWQDSDRGRRGRKIIR